MQLESLIRVWSDVQPRESAKLTLRRSLSKLRLPEDTRRSNTPG